MLAEALKISNASYDPTDSKWSVQLPDLVVESGKLVLAPTSAAGYHSALMQLLTRQAQLQSGEFRVLGVQLQHASRRTLQRLRKSVALLSLDIGIVDDWTVQANAAIPLRVQVRRSKKRRVLVQSALARVGLSGLAHTLARQLTSTQRLQLSLAQALVKSPRLIVAEKCWGEESEGLIISIIHDLSLAGAAVLIEGTVTIEPAAGTVQQQELLR